MIRIGIVGHRVLADERTANFVFDQCLSIFRRALAEHGPVVALSAIAEGADTLFAEAALVLDIPLEIVLPFLEYASDFVDAAARGRYERLRAAARFETVLPYAHRSNEAYVAGRDWIMERSDLLVAVWDGQPAKGPGGTGDSVELAVRRGIPWIHLNVKDHSVTPHNLMP